MVANFFKSKRLNDNRPVILLIDDDKELSSLLACFLEEKGMRAITAPRGNRGLALLRRIVPDLIILDIKMPVMSGHQVLQYIKKSKQFSSVPVLMLTGQTVPEDVTESMGRGVAGYVIKPVDPHKLYERVQAILAHKQTKADDNDTRVIQILEEAYHYGG